MVATQATPRCASGRAGPAALRKRAPRTVDRTATAARLRAEDTEPFRPRLAHWRSAGRRCPAGESPVRPGPAKGRASKNWDEALMVVSGGDAHKRSRLSHRGGPAP